LHAALSAIFYADAVDEWLSVCVDPIINKLARIVNVAGQQIQLGARVRTTCSLAPTATMTNADTTAESMQ